LFAITAEIEQLFEEVITTALDVAHIVNNQVVQLCARRQQKVQE